MNRSDGVKKIKQKEKIVNTMLKNKCMILEEEYISIIEIMKTSQFNELLNYFNYEEAVIVILKFNKCYSDEKISNILNIDIMSIHKTSQKALTVYKETIYDINNSINKIYRR